LDVLWTLEWVVVGLWTKESSSLQSLLASEVGLADSLDLVVAREDLDAFRECLLEMAAIEVVESREGGGGASAKLATDGDCSLDEGTETTTGDETVVPPGLRVTAPGLVTVLLVPTAAPSPASAVCSLTPPTEALSRLYKPLRPLDTSSVPFGSSATGAGGAVRSSKVVSPSVRDAVACIWWSASFSEDPREVSAMIAAGGCMEGLRANGRVCESESAGVGAEGRPAVDSEERHQASDGAGLGVRAVLFVGTVLLSGEAVGRCQAS
jgi:hypothetical protein